MNNHHVAGIDLGGTHMRGGILHGEKISHLRSSKVVASASEGVVLHSLFELTDQLMNAAPIKFIGIGVPSVVNVEKGIVYDVQNIPSWKEVPLKEIMEARYEVPVFINNDANCFALGEKYFGWGKGVSTMVGLSIGTGLGAGIIINDQLYEGLNCGAGEFGMVDYLDQNYEYYASGKFFRDFHHTTGEKVFKQAEMQEKGAIEVFAEFGKHLGNAIKMILYTHDPQLVILGGSVSLAYKYYEQTMWEQVRTFAYPKSLDSFNIRLSKLEHCAIYGAAALCFKETVY